MKRLAPLLVTVTVAALAVLITAAILPATAEADHGRRFGPVAECQSKLETATRELRHTERELARYQQAYEELSSRRHRRGNRAMDQRAFSRLQHQFKEASYSSRQKELVARTVKLGGRLTVAQLAALMRLASYDSTRIDIAVTAYPGVVDRENWIAVYETFDYQSSARTLDRKIGLD